MDTLDRTIMDLAAAQGHALSGKDLKQVKQALSNTFIDSVLDGSKMSDKVADKTSPDEDSGDIMDDDDSEDNTDEKGENEKKLKDTKVLTTDQPTTHSSAITGYRPGTSGMGQVG